MAVIDQKIGPQQLKDICAKMHRLGIRMTAERTGLTGHGFSVRFEPVGNGGGRGIRTPVTR